MNRFMAIFLSILGCLLPFDLSAEIMSIPTDSMSFSMEELHLSGGIDSFKQARWIRERPLTSMLYVKQAENSWIRICLPKQKEMVQKPLGISVNNAVFEYDIFALNEQKKQLEKLRQVRENTPGTYQGDGYLDIFTCGEGNSPDEIYFRFKHVGHSALTIKKMDIHLGSIDELLRYKKEKKSFYKIFEIFYVTVGHFLICAGLICFAIAWYFRSRRKRKFPFITFGMLSISEGYVDLLFTSYSDLMGMSEEIKLKILPFFISLLIFNILLFMKKIFIIHRNYMVRSLLIISGSFILLSLVSPEVWFSLLIPFLLINVLISLAILYIVGDMYLKYRVREIKIILIAAFFPALMLINATLVHLGYSRFYVEMPGLSTIGYFFVFGYLLLERYNKISKELVSNREKLSKLERDNLKGQILSLKNQLNPHFLFNTLGTLMSLIEMDKELAVEYVEELSSVYRYMLRTSEKEFITIAEEVEFIKSYEFLISKRFRDNLIIDLKISPRFCSYLVPPLGIQLLIENAVKHNIISASKPLTIEIYVEDDKFLVVRNNFQKKRTLEKSTGIGLENLRKRYLAYTGEAPYIHADESFFEVKLLLLEKEPELKLDTESGLDPYGCDIMTKNEH